MGRATKGPGRYDKNAVETADMVVRCPWCQRLLSRGGTARTDETIISLHRGNPALPERVREQLRCAGN